MVFAADNAADNAVGLGQHATLQPCGEEDGTWHGKGPECDSSSSDREALGIPYIRNTFLNTGPPSSSRRHAARRSHSAVVSGTCDRYAAEVHALMFKVCPVQRTCSTRVPSQPRVSRGPAAVTATVKASPVADASQAADTSSGAEFGGETHSLHSEISALTAELPTESSAAEDFGNSEAEDEEPEQEKVSEDEPIESVLARVPYDELGRPTSLGSLAHALGECRPCAFLGSEQRPCQNGVRCPFCHLPHPAKRRIRLCRRKRLEMRASVNAAVAEAGSEGIRPPPRYLPISWSTPIASDALNTAGFS